MEIINGPIYISFLDIGKYIRIYDDTPDNRKTKVYTLVNKENELIHLGEIKWNTCWRKYCFYPEYETVFDNKCLTDIITFLNKLNEEYKEKRKTYESNRFIK